MELGVVPTLEADFIKSKMAICDQNIAQQLALREKYQSQITDIETNKIEPLNNNLDRWQRIYADAKSRQCTDQTLKTLEDEIHSVRQDLDKAKLEKSQLIEVLDAHEKKVMSYWYSNLEMYKQLLKKITS